MAYVRENDLTEGLSGRFGQKMVFKQLRGKTIVARRAKPLNTQSNLQRDNRSKFRMATRYAKTMMQDSERKAYYWKKAKKLKLPNAYTAAIADYLRRPKITGLKAGVDGPAVQIKIEVLKKDFATKLLKVTTLGADGSALEEKEVAGDLRSWKYRFVTQKDMIKKIIVAVQDMAGNVEVSVVDTSNMLDLANRTEGRT
jgi:hypothetical protein